MSAQDELRNKMLAHAVFPRMKELILKATGLHYYRDKSEDLAERLGRRLASLRLDDCADYLKRLEGPGGAQEMDLAVIELTIGETYFFRHTEQFDALKETILPEILHRNRDRRRLNIWSAGCASGAEPYSVSILLREHFGALLQDWDVRILGTDINKHFLEQAQQGEYPEWSFRGSPKENKRFFSQVGKKWRIKPEYQAGVSFRQHNLVRDSFPPPVFDGEPLDLILCRNVVIYFNHEDFRQIVNQFQQCLSADGWLLVGHAEPHPEVFAAFERISAPGAILYRRTSGERSIGHLTPILIVKPLPVESDAWKPYVFNGIPGAAAIGEKFKTAPSVQSTAIDALRTLAHTGQWLRAAEGCERLLPDDAMNPALHLLYALILEHLDRHDEAEKALRKTVYLDRGLVLAHYYLALCQRRKSEFAAAERSFQTVLRLLSEISPETEFADADGVTAAELEQLAKIQLEALTTCERRSTGPA